MCLVHEMSQREEGPSGLSLQVTTVTAPHNIHTTNVPIRVMALQV